MNGRYSWVTATGGLLVAVVLLVVVLNWVHDSHNQSIREWCTRQGYEVVSIERVGIFTPADSPFWRHKNDDLCRAVLRKGGRERVSFFRWMWGMEQAWAKGSPPP